MKRVLLMAMLAVSLTLGLGSAYAFPSGPCNPTKSQGAPGGISKVQLFFLLLPTLVNPIA
jgi:hypothetical protein